MRGPLEGHAAAPAAGELQARLRNAQAFGRAMGGRQLARRECRCPGGFAAGNSNSDPVQRPGGTGKHLIQSVAMQHGDDTKTQDRSTQDRPESPGRMVLSVLSLALVVSLTLFILYRLSGARASAVVVYCAQDQLYAEPVFGEFERATGLKVGVVYDSEAVKTVGLANRLLAERAHPQADVFWGNEEMRTRQLAAEGVFRQTNGWAAFGFRSRRMVINTNLLSPADAPRSLLELTNRQWQGKVVLAYPLFGTTATHFHALRQRWPEETWRAWCRGLVENQCRLVDGNSVVVKWVGKGEAWVGLTDSDDIAAGQREGLPVAALPLGPEALLIPNTVGVIRGAPHPEAAQRLFDYLQSPAVAGRLVRENALEGASLTEAQGSTLRVDWEGLLARLNETTEILRQTFLR